MKLKNTIILATGIFLSLCSTSFGGDRAINGLIVGGGSGALVGQAIGRNTESTIIGATVGGILGYVIGNEQRSPGHRGYSQVTTYSQNNYHRPHRPLRPRLVKEEYHYYSNPRKTCKETITIIKKHGKRKRIVSTECWKNNHHRPSFRHPKSYGYGMNDRYNRNHIR